MRIIAILLILFLSACGSKNRDQLYAEGMKKFGEGAYESAAVYFKNALEKDVNFVDARYQLAKAYYAIHKNEQAEKEFSKIALQDPSRVAVHLDLARVYNAMRKPEKALEEADLFLAKDPGSLDALEVKGISHSLKKDYPQAEELLRQVIAKDSARSVAKLELAAIYLQQKKDDDGRALLNEVASSEPKNSKPLYMLASLESARGSSQKALEIYKRIAALAPDDPLAKYKSATIMLQGGDEKGAEAIAEELLKKFPKRGEGSRLKGLIQYSRKQYAEAITSLQNAVKIGPTLDGIYYLGISLYHKGELENSLSQFRRILDVAPDFANARIMTGLVLLTQKRVDDAVNEIRKVLDQDDNNALAHNLMGSALIAKGNFDEGMKELNRATTLNPKIIDAHLKKGIIHLTRGKVGDAEIAFSAAVQVAPEVLNTRLMLASFETRQGKPAKAKEILKAGLRSKSEDAALYNAMAGISFAEGKKDEALGYLNKSKQVNATFAPAYYNLASYYIASGKRDAAKSEYQTLLSKSPSDVRALLGLAALSDLEGNDRDAASYYEKAVQTKALDAYLAYSAWLVKKKDLSKAYKTLDAAIKEIPRNLPAMEMKGRLLVSDKKLSEAVKLFDDIEQVSRGAGIALKIGAYISLRDFSKAEQEAKRVITLNPKSAGSYMVLASVYEAQKDYKRAVSEIQNGLKVDSGNPQALVTLGNLYAVQKDYDRAMSQYQAALRNKSDFVPALFAQGVLFESKGNRKDAVRKYRQIITIDGAFVPALNNLAYLIATGEGKKDEALRLAVTAYKYKPNDAAILDTVGYVLLLNGKNQDALKTLQKAAESLKNNPTVQYHLALAYRATSMKVESTKALQAALALGDFPERSDALKLQKELR